MLTPLLALGLAAAAVAVWSLFRPAAPRMSLSGAVFLAEPPASAREDRRLKMRSPLRRGRFWLRVFLFGALIWAAASERPAPSFGREMPERIGVRLVVDVSLSMRLPSGGAPGETRSLAAAAAARDMLAEALDGRAACVEILSVDVTARRLASDLAYAPEPLARALAAAAPRDAGGAPELLARAAQAPASDACPIAAALVLTDGPPPVALADDRGAPVVWIGVGAPRPNVAIDAARLDAATFGDGDALLTVDARVYGPALERVTAEAFGPTGERAALLTFQRIGDGLWRAEAMLPGPGPYDVRLLDGGDYPGDDAVRVALAGGRAALEWRIDAPPPRGVEILAPNADASARAEAILVAPWPPDGSEIGPAVYVYDGWRRGAETIGVFLDRHELLAGVDFDILERAAPQGLPATDPALAAAGFTPVMASAESGAVWLAARRDPPAYLTPAPEASGPARNLSLIVFYNALDGLWRALSEDAPLDFRASAEPERAIPQAAAEANTFRPEPPPPAPLTLGAAPPAPAAPLWPWIAAAALGLLLIERLVGVDWRPARRGEAA